MSNDGEQAWLIWLHDQNHEAVLAWLEQLSSNEFDAERVLPDAVIAACHCAAMGLTYGNHEGDITPEMGQRFYTMRWLLEIGAMLERMVATGELKLEGVSWKTGSRKSTDSS